MTDESETTGRILVSFKPGLGAKALKTLRNVTGLAPGVVADARDFAIAPSAGWFLDALVVEELGLLALSPHMLDPSGLRDLLPAPLISVRPEYFMRRPRTLRSPVAATDAHDAPRAAVARQTWALDAIGLSPDVAEGRGVVVALLDTGVQADHPDLAPALQWFTPVSFVPGKRADVDEVGHGTHCAGLIAGAVPANGRRYGVAPHVRLMVLRVFDRLDKGPEVDVLSAVRWAIAKGASIISLSAGRSVKGQVMPEDVILGQELARSGVLLVAAAGNESDRTAGKVEPACSPGNAPGILSVGAMTRTGRLWNDSNGNAGPPHTMVDFVAPGVGIESADPDLTLTSATGTSVATPIVAGIAAVLRSREPGTKLNALVSKMKELAHPLLQEPADGVGAGLIHT